MTGQRFVTVPDGAQQLAAVCDELLWCCTGAAVFGPERCTCWEPIFDHEAVAEPSVGEHATVALTPCHDCAFRPDAPEDREYLQSLVDGRQPFWCHYGLRRVIGWTHPKLPGYTHPAGAGDYRPTIINGTPYQVDGSPGVLCHGWTTRVLRANER